jgi:hypothetical protein
MSVDAALRVVRTRVGSRVWHSVRHLDSVPKSTVLITAMRAAGEPGEPEPTPPGQAPPERERPPAPAGKCLICGAMSQKAGSLYCSNCGQKFGSPDEEPEDEPDDDEPPPAARKPVGASITEMDRRVAAKYGYDPKQVAVTRSALLGGNKRTACRFDPRSAEQQHRARARELGIDEDAFLSSRRALGFDRRTL